MNTESSVHKQKHYHDRNCKTREVELGNEGGEQMVAEGWDEGDVRSSPKRTRTGREVKAPRKYSP